MVVARLRPVLNSERVGGECPLRLCPKFSPTFAVQAREFVRAVRTGDTPMSSAAQAVMLMQMLEALRKSGETGRAVRIRPVK